VMLGSSPPELLWLEAMKRELATFEGGVAIGYYHERSFDDMLKLAAALPAHSAIFWNQLRVDGAGVTHEGDESLKRMRAIATAPIFSYDDTFFTGGTVGGPMLSRSEISGKTAAVALQLLAGEKPVAIRPGPIGFAPPRYDWRELQRWNIGESSLPEGSEVYFREATVWQHYRVQFLALSTVFLMQGWLIAALLYERRGRRYADGELRQRMSELARINRYSTAGELSSSIAHEINQPLATILANAETATLMLQQAPPNLDEIRHILLDIQRDNHRASDIVRHLRNLFKGGGFEAKVIDLNEVINEVIEIASATAERHRVQVQSVFETPCIQVEGDAVQLQQVVMNLLMNAIDAVTQEHGPRTVVVRVGQVAGRARLSVIDTGSGVPPEKKEEIFEPLFTTKDGGMGMGLAIVRTIVRAHGGQIRVDDAVGGGAVFLVTLPLAPITHA
jgi:signal transduction histidine kinase